MKEKQLPRTLEKNREQIDTLGLVKTTVCTISIVAWFLYVVLFIKQLRTTHPNPEIIVGWFCAVLGLMIIMGGVFLLANKQMAKLEKNQKVLLKELFKNL